MTRTILAATDLSARSDRAVDRALNLGAEMQLPVSIVHVRDPKESASIAHEPLREAVQSVLPDPNSDCEILTLTGPVPRTIAKAADEHKAAMILTGVARFNSLGDYVTGTAVNAILRHAKVPVLIVKHRPHHPYRRILCAVDFSPHSAKALLAALRLFPQANVIAIHAYHVPFESWNKADYVREEVAATAQKDFEAFLSGLPVSDEDRQRLDYCTGYGDIGVVLKNELDRNDVDLVVFGTHGMGGFRQATIGSIASSLLEWVVPDTLVVPPGWELENPT